MATKVRNWDALVTAVNELHSLVQRKPRSKRTDFQHSPGGILNAYREGDVTFKQAVRHLKSWARRQVSRR